MNKTIISLALSVLVVAASGEAVASDRDRGGDRRDRIERHADRGDYRRDHRSHRDRKHYAKRSHRDARHRAHRGHRHDAYRHYDRDRYHGHRAYRHYGHHGHRHYRAPGVNYYRHARGHHCRIRERHFHRGHAYYGTLEAVILGAVALGVIDELLDH